MSTSLNRPFTDRHTSTMPPCEATVEWLTIDCGELPASAEVARFRTASGVMECHVTVRLDGEGGAAEQAECLLDAYQLALDTVGIDVSSAIFRRMFCSDVVNQSGLFGSSACATSWVCQPPLPASKFSLWAYHLCSPEGAVETTRDGATTSYRRGGLTHHWTTGMIEANESSSLEQTRRVLENYGAWLHSRHMNLADHVVRTWWFVQNIDADYQGLVDARRDFFESHGLTSDTHYIASTGIAGAHPEVAAKVSLDSYAIGGLHPDQLEFLGAPDHLCPTNHYGVTFERATAVSYSDRRHVFISGTASIDSEGRILHPGDVIGQLDRTLENIEALLEKAGANLGDLAAILVYLRDPADGAVIEASLLEKLGAVPFILVNAPVCRPGWLIEIEGIAVIPAHLPEVPEY
ncbi:MAG: hypothetical protein RLZZ214_2815 [Verrucomicrobiota bacterium]|jgi:enamine deaminase RidA (YjgF/YER057c/UK114 family)